jgi:WD40 repeat protein
VAFSVRVAGGRALVDEFRHLLGSGGGGSPRNLTADNPAWDGQPAFSPDGAWLAYVAMDRPGFEADRFHLVLLDLKSGTKHPLTQNWDRSIASFAWAPDGKSLFATADHLGQHPLWAIDAATGRAAAITGDGDVESFSVGPKQVSTHRALSRIPRIFTRWASPAASRRSSPHVNQATLAQRRSANTSNSASGLEQRQRLRLCHEAGASKPIRNIPWPSSCTAALRAAWRTSGTGAGMRRRSPARLRRGDDRFPRQHRLRPSLHRLRSAAIGAASRSRT